ncbi:MAG: tryptophan--tRNA ligase [Deltaproteobacteria bacterium]|nr:MAG: tryptophan--tRNA ligase [Deltaproteobacteria bacterium]
MKRFLTGIQPSGRLHIGNYFGAIKQMLDLQESTAPFIFIANYHALTSLKDPNRLKDLSLNAAIDFLSLGIDAQKSTFWLQSDVKEVLELYWILSQFTPMGLLERAHSFKDKTAKGLSATHGLFSYPVLMAADILLFNAQIVPVGKDQIQHVEIARDIAQKFNNSLGDILVLPEFQVQDAKLIVGTDGAKMSKSYGNTIDIFASNQELEKSCKKITTDSTPMNEPKDPYTCNIYAIAKLFLNESDLATLRDRYASAQEGYGHFKLYLKDVIWDYFAPFRQKREYYASHTHEVEEILALGAKKARDAIANSYTQIQDAMGLR